ncbi:unnamed protein product [Closterium sp. Naga37s-1]|nr:unnamed protein product [Closterium sp. Naga37s-1]
MLCHRQASALRAADPQIRPLSRDSARRAPHRVRITATAQIPAPRNERAQNSTANSATPSPAHSPNGSAALESSSAASASADTSPSNGSARPLTNGSATNGSARGTGGGNGEGEAERERAAMRAAMRERTRAVRARYARVKDVRKEHIPPDVFDYLRAVQEVIQGDQSGESRASSTAPAATFPLPFPPLPLPFPQLPLPVPLPPLPLPVPPFLESLFPGSAEAGVDSSAGAGSGERGAERAESGPPRFLCPADAVPPSDEGLLPRLFFLPGGGTRRARGTGKGGAVRGIEGTGFGLQLHHKTLARLFEVTCLHVPLSDRTDFTRLVDLVEEEVVREHKLNPSRALFLLGESFGALLALAVSARNPKLPITLVLVNPATSFPRSPLHPLIPVLRSIPPDVYRVFPYLLSFTMGNPMRMASGRVPLDASPLDRLMQLRQNLLDLLPILPLVADILPQATLEWKLDLLEEGSAAVEPVLKGIKHTTLIVAGGEDQMLPSEEEAKRLHKEMGACTTVVKQCPNSGHTLLLEADVDLASIIKGAGVYRRSSSRREDPQVDGFVLPTVEEFARSKGGMDGTIRLMCSPVFLSTVVDDERDTTDLHRVLGNSSLPSSSFRSSSSSTSSPSSSSSSSSSSAHIVLGLEGIPVDERPLLFVGNHQTYAPDLSPLIAELLAHGVPLRGLTHPVALGMFPGAIEHNPMAEEFRLFGAVPVTPKVLHRLLATDQAALLFPGGMREALRKRGEEYKLFWPHRAEFVRMAVKFGAVIIPFASVGVDDAYNFVLDADELPNVPVYGERMKEFMDYVPKLMDYAPTRPIHLLVLLFSHSRFTSLPLLPPTPLTHPSPLNPSREDEIAGPAVEREDEIAGPAAERFLAPVVLPKKINRMYIKFGAPIRTAGMREVLTDQQAAAALYAHVKGEVESGIEHAGGVDRPAGSSGAVRTREGGGGERDRVLAEEETGGPLSQSCPSALTHRSCNASHFTTHACRSPLMLGSTRACPLPPHINAKPCCYYSSGSLARALSLTAAAMPLSTHTRLLFPWLLCTSVQKLANVT